MAIGKNYFYSEAWIQLIGKFYDYLDSGLIPMGEDTSHKDPLCSIHGLCKIKDLRVLSIHSPYSFEPLYIESKYIPQFNNKIRRFALENKIPVVAVRYLDEQTAAKLVKSGYASHYIYKYMVLPIKWGSFEQYLLDVSKIHKRPSRYRNRIKREIESIGSVSSDISSEDAYTLFNFFYKRKNKVASPYPKEVFQIISDKMKCFVLKSEGKPMAFSSFVIEGKIMYAYKYASFDKSEDYPYYNLFYNLPIQWAIDNGIKMIRYGGSNIKDKASRGCVDENVYSCLWSPNLLLMLFLKTACVYADKKYRKDPEKYFS